MFFVKLGMHWTSVMVLYPSGLRGRSAKPLFTYNNERIGQGRENTRLFLKDNVELCNEIETKIRESMKDVELFKLGENDAVDIGDDGEGMQEDA